MRVAIYARRSSADEGTGSVPVQLADCRDRAEEEGWDVVAEHADDGISAWDPSKVRPRYERLLEDARAGQFDAVLIREQERLMRQHKDAGRWLELFEETGFHRILCTLESDIDLRRARDQKDFRDRASSAEYYSALLSEKIRRTTSRMAASGAWSGGRKPFGYRLVGGPKGVQPFRLEVEPVEADLIRFAAKHVLGGGTIHSLIRLWSDGPEPVLKPSGARWCYSDIYRILTSDRIAGMRGDVKAVWEPIIDRDTHAALVATLAGNGKERAHEARRVMKWPLASIVFCADCGRRMQGALQQQLQKDGKTRKERRTYACGVATGGCGGVAIAAHRIERMIIQQAMEIAPEVEESAGRPVELSTEQEKEALQKLRQLEDRKRALGGAYAEGLMTPAQVKEATVGLDAEIARLRPALVVSERLPTFSHLRVAADFWDFMEGRTPKLPEAEAETVNEWLRWCVGRVVVRKAKRKGAAFDPGRVSVEWRKPSVA